MTINCHLKIDMWYQCCGWWIKYSMYLVVQSWFFNMQEAWAVLLDYLDDVLLE